MAGNGSKIDGPDLTITDDRASAFIEVGIDRPNLRDTVIRGDLKSYDEDVQRLLLKRAKQLDEKIQAALDGHLVFQAAPPECLRRIHPVICFWDGFPLGAYLYQRIEKSFYEAGLLRQEHVAPFTIISVQELEQLLGLASRGVRITDILRRHADHPSMFSEPLGEFLLATYGRDLEPPSAAADEFTAVAERFRQQLFPEEEAERHAAAAE